MASDLGGYTTRELPTTTAIYKKEHALDITTIHGVIENNTTILAANAARFNESNLDFIDENYDMDTLTFSYDDKNENSHFIFENVTAGLNPDLIESETDLVTDSAINSYGHTVMKKLFPKSNSTDMTSESYTVSDETLINSLTQSLDKSNLDNGITESDSKIPWPEDPYIEPEVEPEIFAEPTPIWSEAKAQWGLAWDIHIYGIGILSLSIAVFTFISIVRLRNRRNLVSRGYFVALNLMLLLFGTTRAIYFLIDAYNSKGIFHSVLAYILFSTAFPCLTSAFSIQLVALLQALKVQTISTRIQNIRILAVVIVSHFLLSLTTDVVVGLYGNAKLLIIICQVVFVVWGLFLTFAYFYVFRRLFIAAKRRQKEMEHLSLSHQHNTVSHKSNTKPKLTMILALKVTILTSILGIVIIALQIYSMISVFSVLSDRIPEAWPWWVYQFMMRIVEILMAITMAYVASQPIRYNITIKKSKQHCPMEIYFPCHRFCWTSNDEKEIENEELKYLDFACPSSRECNVYKNGQYKTFPRDTQSSNKRGCFTNNGLTGSLKTNIPSAGNKTFSADPHSMLVNEDGYIRFRQEDDPLQEPIISTDDELDGRNSIASSDRNFKRRVNFPFSYVGKHSMDQCLNHSSQTAGQPTSGLPRGLNKFKRSTSVPNTVSNTPVGFMTPKSLCSADFDGLSAFSYKPPSSIHLHESIDKALNFLHFDAPNIASNSESQELSDSLSLPKTPDSLGNSNPGFKYDNNVKGSNSKLPNSVCNGSKHKITTYNQCHQSKTDLLRQNFADLRSKGTSRLSLDVDVERSSLDPSDIELALSMDINTKAFLCRSNSDIVML